MPIALSLTKRPEAWHTIKVPADDTVGDVRVKYWLLAEGEVRAIRRRPLERYQAGEGVAREMVALIDALSDEAAEERKALLAERIIDWDIDDADTPGRKLKLTPETVCAICEIGPLFAAFYEGLLAASTDPVKKT